MLLFVFVSILSTSFIMFVHMMVSNNIGSGTSGGASSLADSIKNQQMLIEEDLRKQRDDNGSLSGAGKHSAHAHDQKLDGALSIKQEGHAMDIWVEEGSAAEAAASHVSVPDHVASIPQYDPEKHIVYLYHIEQAAGKTVRCMYVCYICM
jgi:hypothetical protein